MRSATSNHPFNAVTDKYYKMEVEMLRPGTVIPHPTTVSQDIKHLYVELLETCLLETSNTKIGPRLNRIAISIEETANTGCDDGSFI